MRGGIDELQGALKIMASKVVSNEEFAQSPAVRQDGTNSRIEEIKDTTCAIIHGAPIKSEPEDGSVEQAPLTYNKVLEVLTPT